jgi:serine phosphatase RsbU (regulator of sigma subunit)
MLRIFEIMRLAAGQTAALLIIWAQCAFAQTPLADSLRANLQIETNPSRQIEMLNALSPEFETIGQYDAADSVAQIALRLAQAAQDKKGTGYAYLNIGTIRYLKSRYNEALEIYDSARATLRQLQDKKGEAAVSNAMGAAYWRKGDYVAALNAYLNGLSIAEEHRDKKNEAAAYHGIAAVYRSQNRNAETLSYLQKALAMREEIGDKKGASNTLNSLGICYQTINHDSSLFYNLRSMKLKEEINYKKGLSQSIFNIALIYEEQGKFEIAEAYQIKGLKIDEELGDTRGVANSYIGFAGLLRRQKEFSRAIEYNLKAVELHEKVGAKSELLNAYSEIVKTHEAAGNLSETLRWLKKYAELKEETFSESLSKQTAELQAQYETERKNKEIEVLKREQQLQQLDAERQRIIAMFAFALLFSVVAFFLYSFLLKQKSNKMLEQKNREISEKNKNITSSIEYARTIQQAILPESEKIRAIFPEHFILYKPKSIVSGDFYWFCELDDAILLAVIDCTGHGVPGAFMSMIGNALLNEIIIKKRIASPAAALMELHQEVRSALKQNEKEKSNHDGMDISLIRIEKSKLIFSGAKRPLYVVENGGLSEIRGDRFSIGGRERHLARRYTNHELPLQKGLMIYLTTDGFADQSNDKKESFGTKRLKQTLAELGRESAETQKAWLASILEGHQGKEEQRDDITILGIRI